jgi:prevent-host-death family protein
MENTASYGTFEAKTHFSTLLDRVEHKGERIAITRHGKIIAQLIPVESENESLEKMMTEVRTRAQRAKPLGKITTRDLIEEGRRSL